MHKLEQNQNTQMCKSNNQKLMFIILEAQLEYAPLCRKQPNNTKNIPMETTIIHKTGRC